VNRKSEGALEFLTLNRLAARIRRKVFPDRLLARGPDFFTAFTEFLFHPWNFAALRQLTG
jgi:hypothetical protein